MIKVILGIGSAGSGKTTILKKFALKYDYEYICPDDIREEISGKAFDQTKNKEVWEKTRQRTIAKIAKGKTVVVDATFAISKDRLGFIKFLRENGVEKIQGVYVDTPLEEIKKRNDSRERKIPEYAVERMFWALKNFPPEVTDGFDQIFILNKDGELQEVKRTGESEYKFKEFNKIK